MKQEPKYMQDLYKEQADDTLYQQSLEEFGNRRTDSEENLKVQRRTYTNGNAHSGRRQTGVEVLSGNSNAVFSDTKADGTRMNYYATGVGIVNEEASKINGAPKAPEEDLPFEKTVGSETTQEGEV
jgi:hypothetical protein